MIAQGSSTEKTLINNMRFVSELFINLQNFSVLEGNLTVRSPIRQQYCLNTRK